MADSNNLRKRLQNFFSIGVKKNSSTNQTDLIPTKPVIDDKGKVDRHAPLKLTPELQKIWEWWLSEVHDSSESLRDRFDRYKDLDYMVYNDSIISMAAELYADEATQADVQDNVIGVEARKADVKKKIEMLLEKWGFDQATVRNIAWNLAVFGDSFNVNSTDNKAGITDSTPVDVYTVKDRIEFNLAEAEAAMQTTKYQTLLSRVTRLQKLADILSNTKDDIAAYFRSFLFGFQVGEDLFIPPWNMSHFRLETTKSEFYPFGRSLFIYAVSPFRQLKASKNMMALARAASFPKEKFTVKVNETMDQSEQWDAVNEARMEYQNLGQTTIDAEDFSVGSQIWIPENLLDIDLIENSMNLEHIADIELLQDNMIMATRVPKGYLVVDRSSFGTSGQALLQQFKPFGRAVYYIQSSILREITQMVKLHFLMTGEFEKEYTDFELTMNFPVIEESQDRLRMKNDTLRLANDIIGNIQNALGTRDGLPKDVIKSVFSQISFLDPDDVDKWVDQSAEAMAMDEQGRPLVSNTLTESQEKKIHDRLRHETIMESYFDALKKNNIKEGVRNKKHFFNSYNHSPNQDLLFRVLHGDEPGILKEKEE